MTPLTSSSSSSSSAARFVPPSRSSSSSSSSSSSPAAGKGRAFVFWLRQEVTVWPNKRPSTHHPRRLPRPLRPPRLPPRHLRLARRSHHSPGKRILVIRKRDTAQHRKVQTGSEDCSTFPLVALSLPFSLSSRSFLSFRSCGPQTQGSRCPS